MTIVDAATAAVLAFFAVRMTHAARVSVSSDARRRSLAIVRGLRLRHFAPVPAVAALVVSAALLLVQVPGLDFGWWSALGGHGNPVFGSTERTAGTWLEIVIPLGFITLLVPALPLFAEREEVIFRRGAEHWSPVRRVLKGVQFGVVHAVIGIPIGVALALSIGGWWFTWVYLRAYRRGGPAAALLDSTRAHLAYNATLVLLVAAALAAATVDAVF